MTALICACLTRSVAAFGRLLGYGFLGWFWLGAALTVGFFSLRISLPVVTLLFVFHALARAHARARTGREVLLRLHDTVAMALPLPQGLAAQAQGETGKLRRRLQALSDACTKGTPLAQALETSVPEIGPRDLGLIRAGDRTGRLGATLLRLALRRDRPTGMAIAPACILTFMLILVPLLMATFLLVGPKHVAILEGFGITQPISVQILNGSPYFIQEWLAGKASPKSTPLWLMCLYCGALLAVLATPGLLWWWANDRFDSLQSFFSTLAWRCPVLGRLTRERAWSDACLLLSESLRAGEDLPAALDHLRQAGLPWPAARRFQQMRAALQAGQNPGAAAQTAGLPPALAGLMGMTTADLPAMLDEAERLYRLRFDTLAFILRELTKPAMILVAGILVGLFAWACIDSYAHIIHGIENNLPPPRS